MKWVVLDSDLNQGIESLYDPESSIELPATSGLMRIPEMEARCFFIYKNQGELDKDLKKHFELWADLPFVYKFRSLRHYMAFKRHYEIFVGGYLSYYDDRIRSGQIDHHIYFKWSAFSAKATNYWVKIFMNPPALRSPKKINWSMAPKQLPDFNLQNNGIADRGKVMLKNALAESPGPDEEAVDPPPPDSPPPPKP